MKKLLLIAALATFPMMSMAAAPDACDGTGTGTAIDSATDGSLFVRVAFTPVCSANSIVQYGQDATTLWGASGSKKGKNTFIGTTNGGSVKANGTGACADNGCDDTEVGSALSTVAVAAST